MFVRRLVLAFSIFVTGSLALAVAAVAAGGGLGPGNYNFTNRSADAFFGMAAKGGPGGPSWQVSVFQGLNSFKPTHPGVGPTTVSQSTVVYLTEFDGLGNGGFGCFVVPDNTFVVNRDLSASLHATLTDGEICGGYASPIDGGKGGVDGGGSGGLALPISVDITWSATGAVNNYRNVFHFKCLSYSEDGNSTYSTVTAGATGAISALGGSFNSEFADVSSGSGLLSVHSLPLAGCNA
jgi:hypothetical protein